MEGAKEMDADLDMKIRKVDDISVVDLAGDVDAFTCLKLREAIVDLVNEGESRVVIGMSNVNYIDSSGLGTLVGGLRRVSEKKGGLAISGATPQIKKVLSITGLNRVFRLFEDEGGAVRSLKL